MIGIDAIKKILGINTKVCMKPEDMVNSIYISFFPNDNNASAAVKSFSDKLYSSLVAQKIKVIPYESIWEYTSIWNRSRRFIKYSLNNLFWLIRNIFGLSQKSYFVPFNSIIKLSGKKRIKKGVSIVCAGEQNIDELPMQYIYSFKHSSIITIVDYPTNINDSSTFSNHFDTMMSLFAYHMANIIIAVNDLKWMIYNFNASHSIYLIDDKKFDEHILHALIPKIVAPITPHTYDDFLISKNRFDTKDSIHTKVVNEMINGAKLFNETNLYPVGKKIDDLPFRHNFHRLIGKLHLDNRSGMSFGYLAFQMPTRLAEIMIIDDFYRDLTRKGCFDNVDYYIDKKTSELFVCIEFLNKKLVCKIPDVWVLTLRSGADKTHFHPEFDLLKIGLKNCKMWMELPLNLKINRDYKPSFDTKVILAHAVGNALIASILYYFDSTNKFANALIVDGLSISHWHGYINRQLLPAGIYMYGLNNLHVSCSSPQAAIYALEGKLNMFLNIKDLNSFSQYCGDVHIEPHHGINICYPSMIKLVKYILDNKNITELGNKYLYS